MNQRANFLSREFEQRFETLPIGKIIVQRDQGRKNSGAAFLSNPRYFLIDLRVFFPHGFQKNIDVPTTNQSALGKLRTGTDLKFLRANADNQVRFKIEGPGVIAGVGNGNPVSQPDTPGPQRRPAALVRYMIEGVRTSLARNRLTEMQFPAPRQRPRPARLQARHRGCGLPRNAGATQPASRQCP